MDYKITDAAVEFNLLDICNWSYDKFLDKNKNYIPILESNLPNYVVPISHPAQDLVRLCQLHYVLDQRSIMNKDREILFSITAESINKML